MRYLTFCNLMFFLLISAPAICGEPRILGDIKYDTYNDTLILTYDVQTSGFLLDSVSIYIYLANRDYYRIYPCSSKGSGLSPQYEARIDNKHLKIDLKGKLRIPLEGEKVPNRVYLEAVSEKDGEEFKKWVQRILYPNNTSGILNIFPGFGYYKAKIPNGIEKDGLIMSFALGVVHDYGPSSFSVMIQGITNTSDSTPVLLGDYIRFGYEYNFGKRGQFSPTLISAIKYSGYQVGKDLFRNSPGIEIGMRIDGPFEELTYRFSPGAISYHKVELFLPVKSGALLFRAGTRYTYVHYKHFDAVYAQIVLEGFAPTCRGSHPMIRPYRRTFLQKGLAYAGLIPYLPVMLIGVVIDAFPH